MLRRSRTMCLWKIVVMLRVMDMKRRTILLLSILLWLTTMLSTVRAQQSCPMVKMEVQRLPNLNIPRIGHSVFCINGEIVAAGGHTNGFVPTATAEYFSNGEWHLVQMAYPHDQGAIAVTANGEVLLAGGHEKELGIGQTFTVELYNHSTHGFKGYGCLDKRRAFAQALPLDSGCIVISGNWYQDDGIELFDGSRNDKFVKPVSQHRSLPYIIRTAPDNAIIFSGRDFRAEPFDTIVIDRLKGEPFTTTLFETWQPFYNHIGNHGSCFIGDETKGEYVNLIQVMRGDSLMAIARVKGEDFSLLPTVSPIPMQSQWGRICWFSYIMVDRRVDKAYVVGYGEDKGDHRLYVVAIDYLKTPAPVTLLYSEPQDGIGRYQPVLTADGDLVLVGGILAPNNNFDASSTVLLLRVGTEKSAPQESRQTLWLWLAVAVVLIVLSAAVVILRLSTKSKRPTNACQNDQTASLPNDQSEELLERIRHYMEEQKPYLNAELKVQDVAHALNSNRTYISNCIKSAYGCSFSQFVNSYRVKHAQLLLKRNKDMKLSEVWMASGFSTEMSFFRTFKAIAGITPKGWMAKN